MAARYQQVTGPIRRDVARRVRGRLGSRTRASEHQIRKELRLDTKRLAELGESVPPFPLVRVAEDRGFEPLRAINPTRFPSRRDRVRDAASGGLDAGSGRTLSAANEHERWRLRLDLRLHIAAAHAAKLEHQQRVQGHRVRLPADRLGLNLAGVSGIGAIIKEAQAAVDVVCGLGVACLIWYGLTSLGVGSAGARWTLGFGGRHLAQARRASRVGVDLAHPREP